MSYIHNNYEDEYEQNAYHSSSNNPWRKHKDTHHQLEDNSKNLYKLQEHSSSVTDYQSSNSNTISKQNTWNQNNYDEEDTQKMIQNYQNGQLEYYQGDPQYQPLDQTIQNNGNRNQQINNKEIAYELNTQNHSKINIFVLYLIINSYIDIKKFVFVQ